MENPGHSVENLSDGEARKVGVQFIDTRSRELGGRAEGGRGRRQDSPSLGPSALQLAPSQGPGWPPRSDCSPLSGPLLVSSFSTPAQLLGWARPCAGAQSDPAPAAPLPFTLAAWGLE